MTQPESCPFCQPKGDGILFHNALAYACRDKYPASPAHLLLIPFRHQADFFDTTAAERAALRELLDEAKAFVEKGLRPDGYNIGANAGVAAGRTVMHVHLHLIPRFRADVPEPRGGVRGVIPSKQTY